jgi:hypothetical protein
MGKTYYKHRPDEDVKHTKNASRTHGHAKYRKMREAEDDEQSKSRLKLLFTQDWVDQATDLDDDPSTIP